MKNKARGAKGNKGGQSPSKGFSSRRSGKTVTEPSPISNDHNSTPADLDYNFTELQNKIAQIKK